MLNYAKTYRSQGQKALAVTSLTSASGRFAAGEMLAKQYKDGGPMAKGLAGVNKNISNVVAHGDSQ